MNPEEKGRGRGSRKLSFPTKPEKTTEYEFFISGGKADDGDTAETRNGEVPGSKTGAALLGSREDVEKDL